MNENIDEKIVIKKATLSNLQDIQNLNNELFKLEINNFDDTLIENWPLSKAGENYFKDLINNQFVVIAIFEDKVIGYLAATINEQGSYEKIRYGELNNMYVDTEYRKYGIGTKLYNSFKQHCLNNGISDLIVTASAKNSNAIKFYKKIGFNDFNLTLTSKI